jgi:hypothetical protein
MNKQLALYYASFIVFFLLMSLARGWFSIAFIVFWVGGAIGAILPDVDHFIYVYLLRPHEVTSQRAVRMMGSGKLLSTYGLLARTRNERTNLIFHTVLFQIIFFVFTFFVLSSSNSLFGRGIVLAFSLHLLVDQFLDFQQIGSINHWFKNISVNFDKNKTIFYWTAASISLVVFGFLF